jgi:HEAT repeat protein
VPALIDSLNDTDEDVREQAVAALTKIGTPEALNALEKLTKTE